MSALQLIGIICILMFQIAWQANNIYPGISDAYMLSTKAAILKKRKMGKAATSAPKSQYLNTKFLLPTSNILERFFSSARFAFNNYRQKISPLSLEMQLFLKNKKNFRMRNLLMMLLFEMIAIIDCWLRAITIIWIL